MLSCSSRADCSGRTGKQKWIARVDCEYGKNWCLRFLHILKNYQSRFFRDEAENGDVDKLIICKDTSKFINLKSRHETLD